MSVFFLFYINAIEKKKGLGCRLGPGRTIPGRVFAKKIRALARNADLTRIACVSDLLSQRHGRGKCLHFWGQIVMKNHETYYETDFSFRINISGHLLGQSA